MDDNKKKYASLPTPVKLDAPEHPEGYEPPKRLRERATMPEFDNVPIGMPGRESKAPDDKGLEVFRAAQRDYAAKMPPPPPQVRPGDIPRRKGKHSGTPPRNARGKSPRRKPFGNFFGIRLNPHYVNIASWCVAGIATIGIAAWFIMNLIVYNAFAVYLDGELIGHIPYSDTLTSESFHEYAVLSLQATRGGVRVDVAQTVTIAPARVPGNQRGTRGEVVGVLTRRFNYTIAATQVLVHGNPEALMRTQSDLNHLKDLLQERWFDPNGYTVRATFAEGWEEITVHVCPDETEFDTAVDAFRRLDRTRMQMYPYTVQSGDNLGLISVRFGTDINRIMRDNGLTSTNIFPGNTLYIYTSRPLLTVRTYDEIPTEEPITMPIETIYRDDWPSHVSNVIQYGMAGLQETRELIIRENGAERHRETLEAEIIVEPQTHIIEMGTGTGTLEIR
ncbi:MAG: LysM peptidoglycan-binding domain-containing protein [Defluviitaleaceae bacterium]|nr:LysM peptidoglycan-binding domain-containing protein [Defluviitaleaceae bacterium]MCL2261888.1 LysM peptidoglycan-binding domain-containing protein [Defluviitaleaceae bacterium]